jgi:hypothetical protein
MVVVFKGSPSLSDAMMATPISGKIVLSQKLDGVAAASGCAARLAAGVAQSAA